MKIDDDAFDRVAKEAVAPADPIDAAAAEVVQGQRTQLRSSLYSSLLSNPDVAARATALGRQTGLPADVVERNLPEVERKAKLDEFDKLLQDSPMVAQWLSDQNNAKIAHDDVEALKGIAGTVRSIRGPEAGFSTVAAGLLKSLPQGARMAREGVRMQFADLFGFDEMRTDAQRKYSLASLESALSTPEFESDTARGVYGGGTSILRMTPGLAASILTRSPTPALASMGLQTEAEAYGKYRARGASGGEAFAGAVGEGAVETATEMLPMGFLVSKFGKVGAGQFLSGLLMREIPSEQVATLVQDAIDTAVANPDKTWGDYASERPDAAYQTLVATVTQAGVMGAANTVAQRFAGRTQQAQAAEQDAQALTALNDLATASKLRVRDPSSFQAFVAQAMEDGPVQDVYLNANTLAQSGVDVAAIAQASPAVAAQLEEALVTGGDIRIPVDEFAATIAGTEYAQALLPHLKTDAAGMTQVEAQTYMQNQAAELQAEVEKTLATKEQDDTFKASRDVVTAQIFDQLKTAGRFTDDVNNAYASMVGNFYAVQAAKLNITPEEMAARYPLRVQAERLAGGRSLDQGGGKVPMPDLFARILDKSAQRKQQAEQLATRAADFNETVTLENDGGRYAIAGPDMSKPGGYRLTRFDEQGPVGHMEFTTLKDAVDAALKEKYRPTKTDVLNQSAIPDTITIDGKERPTTNSEGKPLAATEEGVKNFWKWFGDSRVVDADGKPLVVYHGSPERGIEEFEHGTTAYGIFFTPDSTTAEYYAVGDDAKTYEVYLKVDNLADFDDTKVFEKVMREAIDYIESRNDDDARDFAARLYREGYGKSDAVTEFFDSQDGFDAVDGESYTIGDLLFDNSVDASEIDDLVAAINTPRVTDAYDDAVPVSSEEMDAAREAYGSQQFYMEYQDDFMQAARNLGYNGVLFADPSSTGGSVSYVVFNPNQIKSATGNDGTFDANDPSILSQNNRGSITLGDDITQTPSVITLLQNADLSTFLHESGHFFLEVMNDMANRPDAPADIKQDMDAVLKWFGVPDLATWNGYDIEQKRKHHEAFARGFEAYLFEDRVPNLEIRKVFQGFRAWITSVYRKLLEATKGDIGKALNVELSDEVRGVFDRMLASSEAIAEAEAARSYGGLFETKPEFMSDEVWATYRDDATNAAQDAAHALESRSLRDMQWLRNARAKLLSKMQRDAKDKRKAVRDEVEAEVMAEPVNRARQFLKHGETMHEDGSTSKAEGVHKLDIEALKEMYSGEGDTLPDWSKLGYGNFGMLGNNGIHPDELAEVFGFQSGDKLVRELLTAEDPKEKIEGITDQRMLERYGELTDQPSIERAVDVELHNDARLRMVATELNALNKALGNRTVLAKAAKLFAEITVGRQTVGRLRPNQYSAAAARAAKAADAAFKAGDLQTARQEKQNQLVNSYAARAAYEARDEVRKTAERFRKMTIGKAEDIAKTRDMDMVQATRAILAEYGIGTRGERATEYLKSVETYDPAMYRILRDKVEAATSNAKPFDKLTVDELRALRDEVDSLWHLARRSRQMEIDGDLLDREDVQQELSNRLAAIGIPAVAPGEGRAITAGETLRASLQSARAALRRVEFWADAKDGSTPMGPFRKFIWTPVKEAADRYRTDKAKFLKQYRVLLDAVAPTLRPMKIDAPELGYTFGFDKGGMGKVELLHAILHTGNESNKKKLLLGRGWAKENIDGSLDTSKWDAFLERMFAEGRLTKADFDFAQGVWDLLEEMKPLAQKAHRDVFGRYFDEVTANGFTTPFGTYRGGYVPAITDSRVVSDAKTRALAEEENNALAFAFPTTSKGFTHGRVEYNAPLLLDLRSLSQHIDKVLLFSHLESPIRDVRRVLTSKTVARPLNRIDPAAFDGMLTPWLNRTARQQVETPIAGDGGMMRFLSVARSRAGIAAMLGNVSNTAQQITGLSIAMLKADRKHLLPAVAQYIKAPRETARAVAESSEYMAARMDNEVAQMTDAMNDILLNPGVYESAVNWTARHAYFMQAAVDNVIGPIVWTSAYNKALEAGQTENDARRMADSAVRMTQGSTLPEDVSRFETGNAFVRLFTQFASYFNMQANLLGTEFAKVAQEMGVRQGAGRMLYITAFGFLAPAWVAEAIAQAFRGGPDDEDKDGEYLDEWLAAVFGWGTVRSATALVPVAGHAANALVNASNSKPYDDRLATSPAISMIESAARAPTSVYKAVTGEGKPGKAVRDVATLVTLATGLPLAPLARPIGYLTGVAADDIDPTGPVDAVRGTITGAASPDSR